MDEPDTMSTPTRTQSKLNTSDVSRQSPAGAFVTKAHEREMGLSCNSDVGSKLKKSWPPEKKNTEMNTAQRIAVPAPKNMISDTGKTAAINMSFSNIHNTPKTQERKSSYSDSDSLMSIPFTSKTYSSSEKLPSGKPRLSNGPLKLEHLHVSPVELETGSPVLNRKNKQTTVAPIIKTAHPSLGRLDAKCQVKLRKSVRFAAYDDFSHYDQSSQQQLTTMDEKLWTDKDDGSQTPQVHVPKDEKGISENTNSSNVNLKALENKCLDEMAPRSNTEPDVEIERSQEIPQVLDRVVNGGVNKAMNASHHDQSGTESVIGNSNSTQDTLKGAHEELNAIAGNLKSLPHNPVEPTSTEDASLHSNENEVVKPESTKEHDGGSSQKTNSPKAPLKQSDRSKVKLGSWSKGRSPLSKLFPLSGNGTNKVQPKDTKKPPGKPSGGLLGRMFQSSLEKVEDTVESTAHGPGINSDGRNTEHKQKEADDPQVTSLVQEDKEVRDKSSFSELNTSNKHTSIITECAQKQNLHQTIEISEAEGQTHVRKDRSDSSDLNSMDTKKDEGLIPCAQTPKEHQNSTGEGQTDTDLPDDQTREAPDILPSVLQNNMSDRSVHQFAFNRNDNVTFTDSFDVDLSFSSLGSVAVDPWVNQIDRPIDAPERGGNHAETLLDFNHGGDTHVFHLEQDFKKKVEDIIISQPHSLHHSSTDEIGAAEGQTDSDPPDDQSREDPNFLRSISKSDNYLTDSQLIFENNDDVSFTDSFVGSLSSVAVDPHISQLNRPPEREGNNVRTLLDFNQGGATQVLPLQPEDGDKSVSSDLNSLETNKEDDIITGAQLHNLDQTSTDEISEDLTAATHSRDSLDDLMNEAESVDPNVNETNKSFDQPELEGANVDFNQGGATQAPSLEHEPEIEGQHDGERRDLSQEPLVETSNLYDESDSHVIFEDIPVFSATTMDTSVNTDRNPVLVMTDQQNDPDSVNVNQGVNANSPMNEQDTDFDILLNCSNDLLSQTPVSSTSAQGAPAPTNQSPSFLDDIFGVGEISSRAGAFTEQPSTDSKSANDLLDIFATEPQLLPVSRPSDSFVDGLLVSDTNNPDAAAKNTVTNSSWMDDLLG